MTVASNSILSSVRGVIDREPRLVLAVSGGVDSMTLLDAVARVGVETDSVIFATFDHGTGVHADRAARLVEREASARGFRVRVGRANLAEGSEAEWRAARLRFLRSVALEERATLVTAHTRDDHLETVVMRILRGSGVRGLAGLLPASGPLRPLLGHTRVDTTAYAQRYGVRWLLDPTNASRAFFRNRIRLDILPALVSARPHIGAELLQLSAAANDVRLAIDRLAMDVVARRSSGELVIPAAAFALDEPALRLLWQGVTIAAGVQADWRAIMRLSRFSRRAQTGARCELSGDVEVWRERDHFVLRIPAVSNSNDVAALGDELTFGSWRFLRVDEASFRKRPADPWIAALPGDTELIVRSWKAGDRMSTDLNGGARRVKRFFADAHIAGPRRMGWPIVMAQGRIVWIPGVRRSPLAEGTTSRPSIVYRCERQPG